jgi:hypothetical protein
VLFLDDDTDVGFDELGLLPAFGVPLLAQVVSLFGAGVIFADFGR